MSVCFCTSVLNQLLQLPGFLMSGIKSITHSHLSYPYESYAENNFFIVFLLWKKSHNMGFPDSSVSKESTCNAGDLSSIPGSGRSAQKGRATHSSILAWRIPWTVQPT